MRKIFSILTSMFLVFSFAGAVTAQVKSNPNLAAGAVTAIDAKSKTVTIKEDKTPALTFSISDKTMLKSNNGRQATFDDIKIGTILVLTYAVVDGKKIAKEITLAGQVSPQPSGKKAQSK